MYSKSTPRPLCAICHTPLASSTSRGTIVCPEHRAENPEPPVPSARAIADVQSDLERRGWQVPSRTLRTLTATRPRAYPLDVTVVEGWKQDDGSVIYIPGGRYGVLAVVTPESAVSYLPRYEIPASLC